MLHRFRKSENVEGDRLMVSVAGLDVVFGEALRDADSGEALEESVEVYETRDESVAAQLEQVNELLGRELLDHERVEEESDANDPLADLAAASAERQEVVLASRSREILDGNAGGDLSAHGAEEGVVEASTLDNALESPAPESAAPETELAEESATDSNGDDADNGGEF